MTSLGRRERGHVIDLIFEKVFDDGEACTECKFHQCAKEPHGEYLCECNAPRSQDCPGVREVAELIIEDCDAPNEPRKPA